MEVVQPQWDSPLDGLIGPRAISELSDVDRLRQERLSPLLPLSILKLLHTRVNLRSCGIQVF